MQALVRKPLNFNALHPRANCMAHPDLAFITPATAAQWAEAKNILREYASSLDADLCFQDFEGELLELPGQYAVPRGAFFLAIVAGQVAGCCALRPLDDVDYPNACEMKRLYVRPAHRGSGLGRLLAERVLDAARQDGYDSILLDTLSDMESARALYEDLGFEEVPPYYHNPIAGAHYLRAEL